MGFLKTSQALKLLQRYRLPFVKNLLVRSQKEAELAFSQIGPAAIKLSSPDIVHKSDLGLVKLNILSREEAGKAFAQLTETARKKCPKAKIEGVLVEEMLAGLEIIVGMKRDQQFGPVIMFGLGGVFVEVMKEVSFRIAPLTREDAEQMIQENKGFPVLAGARGTKYNTDSIIEILLKLSKLSMENPKIAEIDFNPIILGKEAVIADFRVKT